MPLACGTDIVNPMRPFLMLLVFVVLAFSAAAFGASFPPGEWYAGLEKPFFNPPSWLFGPVWTVLYLTIAVSGWLVWRQKGFGGARRAFAVYFVQLFLNALWSWLFFGLHFMGLAFVEILLLWGSILATIVLFQRHHRFAGWLLVPYLLWVSFASVLNGTLWWLNR